MGKLIRILTFVLLLGYLSGVCYAVDFLDETENFISVIPDEAIEIIGDNADYETVFSKLDFGNILNYLFNLIKFCFSHAMSLFLSLLSIILLFQIVNSLNIKSSQTLNTVISTVGICSVVLLTFDTLNENIALIRQAIEKSMIFSGASVPSIAALCISSGKSLTATLYSTTTSLVITFFHYLTKEVLLVLLSVYIVIGICDRFVSEFNFIGICSLIKKIIKWILISFISLFSFSVALQNILTAAGDTFIKRSIQTAVGKLIPVVGGTLSGGIETIFALAESTGTVLCIIGMLVIAIIFVPIIVGNLIYGCFISVCKYISIFFNLSNLATIYGIVADAFYILTAIVSASCFLLIASFAFVCINIG